MATRMNKTVCGFNWTEGYYKRRTLTRSFETLEAVQKFAEGKDVVDVFLNKGKFVVEWVKTIDNNGKDGAA